MNSTIKLVTDTNGGVLSSDLYTVKTPPLLTAIMLDFINSLGVKQLFDFCIGQVPRSFKSDITQSPLKWDIRKRPLPDTSDMYWISPADAKSHFNMLSHLGTGGFDVIVNSIASVCDQVVTHLTIYQLTFMVVSYCSETRFHTDNDDTLAGNVWTVIIPIILPPASTPELIVKKEKTKVEQPVKYNLEEALVWGPATEHSTAITSYNGNYRVCISASVAFITTLNVKQIMMDMTQKFPPRKSRLMLQWARTPHWSRSALLGNSINVPHLENKALLGMEWYEKYSLLKSLLNKNVCDADYPSSLRQWMAYQRYCFTLKYQLRKRSYQNRNCRSASRTLTFAREEMLKEIGFDFTRKRDEGANRDKWICMLEELKKYHNENGHINVKSAENVKLFTWIGNQKRYLKNSSKLSDEKKKRKEILLQLGLKC
jgi:hypothetical protein